MKKILIVDDESVIRMLYEEELTAEGYHVISTSDCEGLVEIIRKQTPDVIVLDIMMGDHSGLDLLQKIRKTFYNLPVILSTSYSTFKRDLRSIASDYYVVKSSDLTELKSAVRMSLEASENFSQALCHDKNLKGAVNEKIPNTIS